jgi:predicted acylesterase/phospholipase RssA
MKRSKSRSAPARRVGGESTKPARKADRSAGAPAAGRAVAPVIAGASELGSQPVAKVAAASDVGVTAAPTYRVLSLDGGGIRGLLTAIWLRDLRQRLGSPLRDHFHLIAGTSTGSILACAVASGREPDEIIALYRDKGEDIFPGLGGRLWSRVTRLLSDGLSAPKYDGTGLVAALQEAFGDLRFGDLPTRTMVVAYDTQDRSAKVFKSWRMDHEERNNAVWELVASSCSAPVYFPAFPLTVNGELRSMIDGGVSANNPCACAVAEAVRLNSPVDASPAALPGLIVASFGTGQVTRPIPYEAARQWGAVQWMVPIIDVLMDGSGDATSYIVEQLVGEQGYFRFNAALTDAYDDLDNASGVNLNALEGVARAYLTDGGGNTKMARLANLLMTTGKV